MLRKVKRLTDENERLRLENETLHERWLHEHIVNQRLVLTIIDAIEQGWEFTYDGFKDSD